MEIRRISDELYHHGIKGQEWGVKHGPPYPLGYSQLVKAGYLNDKQKRQLNKLTNKNGDYVIKKGTEFSRVTTNKNESDKGSKYMSFLDDDKNTYRYDFSHNLDGNIYEDIYKSKKDILVASHERTISTVLDKIGNKKVSDIMSEKDLTWEKKTTSGYLAKDAFNKVKDKTLKDFYKDIETPNSPGKDLIQEKENRDLANNYVRIGSRILNKTLYEKTEVREATISELKKQGYNAMVDIEDAFGYSTLPLITFDDDLKKVKQKVLYEK